MVFVVHFMVKPEHRDANFARLHRLEEPHHGVKILQQWVSVTLLEGWATVEANDAVDVGKLLARFTSLNVNVITPVVNLAGYREIFATT